MNHTQIETFFRIFVSLNLLIFHTFQPCINLQLKNLLDFVLLYLYSFELNDPISSGSVEKPFGSCCLPLVPHVAISAPHSLVQPNLPFYCKVLRVSTAFYLATCSDLYIYIVPVTRVSFLSPRVRSVIAPYFQG